MNQLLSWLIFLPVLGAGLILMLPAQRGNWSRTIGLFISVLVGLLALVVCSQFDPLFVGLQFATKLEWLPQLGVHYEIGIDGINLPLMTLTALLTPFAFLGTWSLLGNGSVSFQRRMTALILIMETGALGTFLSQDIFLFYIFWEVILIPAYLLIGIYGGVDRLKTTLQFFIYTFAGSMLMLVAIVWLIWNQKALGGIPSGSFSDLQNLHLPFNLELGWAGLLSTQGLLFVGFAAAFFIKSPLVPLHAWLPSTYTQAPTLVSIYLAAILSKMGTYGILKILMPMFPEATRAYAPVLMWLAAAGIVYGALLAIVQKNLKSVIAYSSLSHVSYILLGMFSLQPSGLSGALLQMVNHGIAIAGLFLIVGWLESRRGSLELSAFGGLAKTTPLLASAFMVMILSSVALPGTNGFVGEFLVLMASFRVEQATTVLAASGMVLGAVYMLNIYQKTMFGSASKDFADWSDLQAREVVVMLALVAAIIGIGVAPQSYLQQSRLAVETTVKRINPDGFKQDQAEQVSKF